jgi:hypothetical protein
MERSAIREGSGADPRIALRSIRATILNELLGDLNFNSRTIRRHDFAISPRIRASFTLNVLPPEIRGRRECRAPAAPAASRAK